MLDRYKNTFTEARWNELCELVKDKGMSVKASYFTTSELRLIIDETRLSPKEKEGAIMFFISKKRLTDIADELGYSDSNVKYHKKLVSRLLRETCCRIFK